jgi:hypothetical protein
VLDTGNYLCQAGAITNSLVFLTRAIAYYKRAADLGDKRAAQRLRGSQSQPQHQPGGPGAVLHRGLDDSAHKGAKDKDCIIM